jgi:hypothetical protein
MWRFYYRACEVLKYYNGGRPTKLLAEAYGGRRQEVWLPYIA